MATHSTVPTVRAQLVTLLRARPGMADTTVTPTSPGDAQYNEAIFLGRARGAHDQPVSRAGRLKREEDYVLDVWIEVVRPGRDGSVAEDRAFALFGELEDVVADDPVIGLAGTILKATVGKWEEHALVADTSRGWTCQLRVEVAVKARLS